MLKAIFLPLLLSALASPAWSGSEFYCCQDPGTGRRVCGDTLPDQCRGRAYRVLDGGGNIVREVGPPLTPEQRAEQILENKRRRQLEEAGREQRRRDQALLDTYATAEDIDLAQKKAESDVKLAMIDASSRLEAARGKRAKLDNEAEFYKKKQMPVDLAKDLQAINHEIKLQQELLDLKRRDFDMIKAKYDADRKRYFELTRHPVAPGGSSPPPR